MNDSVRFGRTLARRPSKAAAKLPHFLARAHVSESARGVAQGILERLAEAGRCARCGRKLTDPESIARSVGPDCYRSGGPLDLSVLRGPGGPDA